MRNGTNRGGGFTLVELLVVLMVLGLLVGTAALIARPDERGLLQLEARRLAMLLDLAATTSRMSGRPLAWSADAAGYRFLRFHEDAGWAEVRGEDSLRARSLPQGMMVSALAVESMPRQGALRLEFLPHAPPLSFSIEMSLGAERYAIAGSPLGEVRALPGAAAKHGDAAAR